MPAAPHTRWPESRRRLAVALALLAALASLGTVGYVLIEGASWLDALFMTITTLTTVGYGEVFPLSAAGRIFTMLLILGGVGTVAYLLSVTAQGLVESGLRDFLGRNTMQRQLDHMHDHVVICGYGRFGRVVTERLTSKGTPVVVIDQDAAREAELVRASVPYLIGSALADDVLERAGIRRARALVVGTASDPDNVFITLSAREKNPTLAIHARGESDSGLRRLELAGATQVVSAYQMGGLRIAASLLRPNVVDFLELGAPAGGEGLGLEELRLPPGSPLDGATVAELEQAIARVRVVGLRRGEEALRLIPVAETRLTAGDLLVLIGDRSSLEQLAGRAQTPAPEQGSPDR